MVIFKGVIFIVRAYIYFFPEGIVEEAAVQITNRDQLIWTLATHPITGRTDVIQKAIRLEDLKTNKWKIN